MPSHHRTTFSDREQIVRLHQEGKSYATIAQELGWKTETVKKLCLCYQRHPESGLQPKPSGRRGTGILSVFNPLVRFALLRVKREHPEWGATVVLDEVAHRPSVKGLKLPKVAQVGAYFHQFGGRLLAEQRNLRLPASPDPIPEGREVIVFQLDMQERLCLESLGYFNVLNMRAPKWGITVGCFPHPAGEERWERKVSQGEAREDCRTAFEKWGLPDILQTDKDKVLVCTSETPFPTDFTLWIVGLGIYHRIIQRVTQNGSVERTHRTFDKQMLSGVKAQTWEDFLLHVQAEQNWLNERIPSRAKSCCGKIPIQAHPEALTPKRPYQRQLEDQLFEMRRVYQYLSNGKWIRKASRKGQFHFADQVYSVGVAQGRQCLIITFDLESKTFVVYSQAGVEIKRLSSEWLTQARICGLPENEVVNVQSDT